MTDHHPTDVARAHVSPPTPEPTRTPRPGCVVCEGTGKFHHQVPGEFRVVTRECQCWRLA